MAQHNEENADGASIRPVSSLRSHFENISGTTTAANTARLSPRHEVLQQEAPGEHHSSERASLDLPRRPSPWSTPGNTSASSLQPGLRASGPPATPRIQRPRSALLQRPVSTRPCSPPRAPPQVKIESPKSPPKLARTPKASFTLHAPSPKPVTTGAPGTRSAPPIPPHSPRYGNPSSADVRAQTLAVTTPGGNRTALVREVYSASNNNAALAILPPPVNRADKPKVPVKPPNNKLRPFVDSELGASDDKVSPFSTPPSSDDSTTPGSRTRGARHGITRSPATQDANPGRYFSQSPIYHSLQAQQQTKADSLELKSRNSYSIPRVVTRDVEDDVSSRPGLPPRRMTEKGPQQQSAFQRGETRIASMSRLSESREQEAVHDQIPPLQISKQSQISQVDFLPPPRRTGITDSPENLTQTRHGPSPTQGNQYEGSDATSSLLPPNEPVEAVASVSIPGEYPDASLSNRRPPRIKQGIHEIDTGYDTRLFDICGDCVCTSGYLTRAWDLARGYPIMNLNHGEQTKVTAMAFKPGALAEDEGQRLWIGTNYGDLMEVDVVSQSLVNSKVSAHNRREILRIHRHQHAMWTLDDGGNLHVWTPDATGLPCLDHNPLIHRLAKGHTFSIVVHHRLWVATGKDIRVFQPGAGTDEDFLLTLHALNQPNVGEVTSGAVISNQHDRVYFGHSDGKVTVYSTDDFRCLGVFNVSVYKINTLAGAGNFLWAGFNTGMIYVYDTRARPWITKKDWHAHSHPVANIIVDRSSVWKSGLLQVASIGTDNAIRLWDGMLEDDWLVENMQEHDLDYCSFREMSAVVVTWNAGAATPGNFRYEETDTNFFRDVLQPENPPDFLIFGFQELVDLENKKLTAKSLFKGNKKKDPSEQEHVGRQYRAWRDYLVRCIEDTMPSDQPFHLLHTASLVGLFSCVFVKADMRNRIANQSAAEIKRGMGGLHGNKGCLIVRFLIDGTSLCLVNCHLAAGQTQTVHRNNDVSAILESTILPSESDAAVLCDSYTGGGDGSMILDHDICILNGDLNYRIDTMSRDTVVKAIQAGNYTKLLERDQLLVSRRRNPLFRLRAFTESPITFAPTYKYDVGTDRYDTSEKHRAPAWCDRILYRGPGKIKQLGYRRHELRVSDHRPVSATFRMRIKSVVPEKRAKVWQACLERFEAVKEDLTRNAKIVYLRDVLGVDVEEASTLV